MLNKLQNISPELILRSGLGVMYIYSGIDFLVHPEHWQAFVPQWIVTILAPVLSLDSYLIIQGVGELIIGAVFLSWFLPKKLVKVFAVISAVEFAGILIFVGVDLITFRDIGLLGASFALAVTLSVKAPTNSIN